MKTNIRSTSFCKISRRRFRADLPETTEAGSPGEAPAAAAPAKKGKAEKKAPAAKKEAPKKGAGKKEAAKPAAAKSKKAPAEKKEATPRKPRVEGRVDLVFRSGPERAIAIKLGEKHKAGDPEKVDNCTVGFTIKGTKGEALAAEYIANRDEWRSRTEAMLTKFLSGEIKIKGF